MSIYKITYKNDKGMIEVDVMREGAMFFTIRANKGETKKLYLQKEELTFLASMLFDTGYFEKYKCIHDKK